MTAPADATRTPLQWMLELLDAYGSQPLGGRLRQCPAPRHGGDTHPSLSISERGNGVRLHCFADCPEEEVLAALGVGVRQLYQAPTVSPQLFAALKRDKPHFPPVVLRQGHPANRGFRLEAVHTYAPADGVNEQIECHQLLRWRHPATRAKELMWETRLVSGGSVPGLMGTPEAELPLYREREIRMAVAVGEKVIVVESESSVDALKGWYATTWAGGAGDVNLTRLAAVLGTYPDKVHIPDFDRAGLACLRRMQQAHPGAVVLIGQPGEDARDLYHRLGAKGFAHAVNCAITAAQPSTATVTIGNELLRVPLAALDQIFARADAERSPPSASRTRAAARHGPDPPPQPSKHHTAPPTAASVSRERDHAQPRRRPNRHRASHPAPPTSAATPPATASHPPAPTPPLHRGRQP